MSSFPLNLPDSLKNAAKRLAAADDTTMNQLFVVAIAEKISAMETSTFFERRATLANHAAADAAWGKVSVKEPISEDKWLQPAYLLPEQL